MRYFIIICLMLVLSSCSMFSPVKLDGENAYVINTIPQVPIYSVAKRGALLVPEPISSPLYSTTQIAYTHRPYQVSYFAKNRWIESPSAMIQAVMIQALQNNHYYRAIISTPYVGRYQYVLSTQLLQLQQDFSRTPSVVRFKLRAQLIRMIDGQVMATREFSSIESTSQDTPYGGVVAANRAVSKVTRALVEFTNR